jgi:PAS domain S-box-containing protein
LFDFKANQSIGSNNITVSAAQSRTKKRTIANKDLPIQTDGKPENVEAFSRAVLNTSPDCIKVLDAEGRLQYMNANGYCLMEIDDFALFKGKYWWDLWPEENKHLIKGAVATAQAGKKTQFQAFSPTAKGALKWWDVIVLPMHEGHHDIEAPLILSISRDITKQKQHELNEKELLTRFQNLVLQAPVAICVLRGEQYLIEVINDGMLHILDRKMEEVVNKPAFEVLSELKGQGFKGLLDDVYNTGKPFIADELPVTLKRNGKLEEAYVKFIYEPLRAEDGSIIGVMVLAHEITGQVVARKRMEAQALMVQNMLMTAPAFVFTTW